MSSSPEPAHAEGKSAAPAPEPRRPLPWSAIVGAVFVGLFAFVMDRTFQAELAAERAGKGRKPQPTAVLLGLNDPATLRAREDEALRMRTARSATVPPSASATPVASSSSSASQSQNPGDFPIAIPSASSAAPPPVATPPATNTPSR
jgi:hypothetical protein